MLISCTSCNSRYLVNSADLKPVGRTVQCAKCANQWYLTAVSDENEEILETIHSSTKNENTNLPTPNLPSTYVKEKKVSVLNSILVILFVLIFILFFWIIQNTNFNNNIAFIEFYFNEFIFNLKLIFNDIAKIIYKIIN